jgi:hypothetical protein
MLHNPLYAGAYAYGRCRAAAQIVDGKVRRTRHRETDPAQWSVIKQQAHPGYITWEQYLQNQTKLQKNMARMGNPHRGAPREGSALLNGLLVCEQCGRRMSASYTGRTKTCFSYVCSSGQDRGLGTCWTVPGAAIDAAVEALFLETMVPEELALCLAVEGEVQSQVFELDRAWRTRVEQASYEARRAERRYKVVDPDNRVVARTLEREWEEKLRELEELEQQHDRARRSKQVAMTEDDRRRVRALSRDLPKVWRADSTTPTDRKAMLRLAIEAIGIRPVDVPRRATALRVQWHAGEVTELDVPRPDRKQRARTPADAATRLRQLADTGLRDEQMAEQLNAEGFLTGKGQTWTSWAVKWARRKEGIARHYEDRCRRTRLPDRHPDGRYCVRAVAERFGVSTTVVHRWIERGIVKAHKEAFREYRGVYWIRIDKAAVRRLEKLST